MGIAAGVQEALAAKFAALFPHLDERQRRLAAGAEARSLGHCTAPGFMETRFSLLADLVGL